MIIPRNQTKIINVSKNSLTKCKKRYKEILIDLKEELQFCQKNYKFIIHAIKKYTGLNKKDKNRYPMLDEKINLDFNNQWINKNPI